MRLLIFLVITYLFVSRDLGCIYYIQAEPTLNAVYVFISKIAAVLIILYYITRMKKTSSFFIIFSFSFFPLFFSTLLNGGDFRRFIELVYPMLATCALLLVLIEKKSIYTSFINVISSVYLFIAIINLLLIIFTPNLYGYEEPILYLLGNENYVGFPLMIGLLFNIAHFMNCKKRTRLIVYAIVQAATVFLVFSATSVVAFSLLLIALFFKPLFSIAKRMSLGFMTLIYAIGFIFIIIIFAGAGIIDSSFTENFLGLLGKDTTLSGRTDIWAIVLIGIISSPLLGHGIASSESIFYHVYMDSTGAHPGTSSAHNQILQTLYEGGFITVLAICLVILFLSKKLIKAGRDEDFMTANGWIKLCIIAILVMYMGESSGLCIIMNALPLCYAIVSNEKYCLTNIIKNS